MIKQIIKDNGWFYYPYFILLLICTYFLLVFNKGDVTVFFNSHNTPFLDVFFKYYTYVGTFWVCIPIVIYFFRNERMYAYLLLSTYAISGVVTQLLKRFFIEPNFRPYWELQQTFHQVEGESIKKMFSFPSGHTCTAFLMFLVFAYYYKNHYLSFVFFIAAVFVGISRMYLYQHFFVDTVVGSFMGVLFTTVLYIVFKRKKLIA